MSFKSFIESTFPNIQMTADSLLPKSSYGFNLFGFAWGAISFNQWVMGITLVLGILTFIVNFYYQRQRNKMERAREAREDELHRARMQQIFKPDSSDG
jgi:hypothetical protein